MYETYLENELSEILKNFDNIYNDALINQMDFLKKKLETSPEKLKIVKKFLNEEKYIELRKFALKGFFNALNMVLESNEVFLIHKKFPVVLVGVDKKLSTKKYDKEFIKVERENHFDVSKNLIDIVSKNILYFPFHYDMLHLVRHTFSNSKYYEMEQIFEQYDFSKMKNKFLVNNISDLYEEEDYLEALSILEFCDNKRRPLAANPNEKVYLEKIITKKFEKSEVNEKLELINLLFNNDEYYKEYLVENKKSKIFFNLDKNNLNGVVLEFLKNNPEQINNLSSNIMLNILNHNIQVIAMETFDALINGKSMNGKLINETKKSTDFLDKIAENLVQSCIELNNNHIIKNISIESDYKEKVQFFIDDKWQKYRVKNGLRETTEGVDFIENEEDKNLVVILPKDFYGYINKKDAIEFNKMFNLHTLNGFVILDKVKNRLVFNLSLDEKLKINKEYLMDKIIKYLNDSINYIQKSLENDNNHNSYQSQKIESENMLNSFIREINLINNLSYLNKKTIKKKKI